MASVSGPDEVGLDIADLQAMSESGLFKRVPTKVQKAIARIPNTYLSLADHEIRRKFNPGHWDYQLRTAFWAEYERATKQKCKMVMIEVYGGVCSEYFWNDFLENRLKMAWLIRPIQRYNRAIESLLMRGTERLWEIIDSDFMDDDNKINAKRAQVVMSAIKHLDERVNGMAVQRSVQDQRRVEVKTKVSPTSMKEIEDKIATLQAELDGRPAIQVGASGEPGGEEETP